MIRVLAILKQNWSNPLPSLSWGQTAHVNGQNTLEFVVFNAVKFTQKRASVIGISKAQTIDSQYSMVNPLKVCDTGVGIPQEELAKILLQCIYSSQFTWTSKVLRGTAYVWLLSAKGVNNEGAILLLAVSVGEGTLF